MLQKKRRNGDDFFYCSSFENNGKEARKKKHNNSQNLQQISLKRYITLAKNEVWPFHQSTMIITRHGSSSSPKIANSLELENLRHTLFQTLEVQFFVTKPDE